jgi:CheY-like chemotaxis protein
MKATILLVEDNEVNADMLSRRLTRRGLEVITAVDGLQAVERARSDLPDLILMDMSLPEIDGWEATRRIKADPTTAGIPVIALTAHALVSDRNRSFEAGCDEFETKPINLTELLDKMAKFLGVQSPA